MKDSTQNKISIIVDDSIQATVITKEADNVSKIINHSSQKAEILSQTEQFITQTDRGFRVISDIKANYEIVDEANALRAAGSGASLFKFFGIGTIIGISLGACEIKYSPIPLDLINLTI